MYKYRAKKGPKEVINSVIVAASREDAVEKITQMGYIPVRVEETSAEGSVSSVSSAALFEPGIKPKMITVFTRQLSILLHSGVPILKSLTILAEQSHNPGFRRILSEIRSQVKDGRTLSSALSLYPRYFSPLYLSLVRAGEDSGTLEELLLRIADYRYKQEQIISTVRTALTYPLLMALVGTGTIIFMLVFVMPRLLKVFARLGQELPLPTKILMGVSNFMTQWWVWLVIALIILALLGFLERSSRSKKGQLLIGQLKLHAPLFREVFLKLELARFSRTLELLLKSGIQLLRAIDASIPTLNNEVIRQELRKGYKLIEQGESFGTILNRSHIFPKFMVNLVAVGEESGKVETALHELADTYENETDEAVKIMTNLLEPLMILFMGIVVGFIIMAMLLPVFQLNVMVQ